jgi:hypothetical protein
MVMYIFYNRKHANPHRRQSGRGHRRLPGKPTDPWQQPATPIRTSAPPPSSPASRYAAGYAPAHSKEPTTAPPLRRKVMNTDPELPGAAVRQRHVPPRAYQADTQKLSSGENDEPSLSGQLERFAIEIERSFKRMQPGARLVSLVILFGLFLVLHILWQVADSLINPIYLILGIITSIIIIYERFFEKK